MMKTRHSSARRIVQFFGVKLCMALAVLFCVVADGANENARKTFEPSPFESALTRIVGQLIERVHYTRTPLNDDLSSMVFDEYFKALDRDHRFFLKSDVMRFNDARFDFDDMVRQGDLSVVFEIYNLYLDRVRERVEFVRNRLQQPLDFSQDEEIVIDRSEIDWVETREELDDLWRRQLKNRILVYRMMEQNTEDEQIEGGDGATPVDGSSASDDDSAGVTGLESGDEVAVEEAAGDAVAEPATTELPEGFIPDRRTPEERAVAYYERYLKYLEENESIDVLDVFLNSLTRSYDPHSNYLAPMSEEDFEIDMSLSLEGIGALLSSEDGYVEVVDIIPGGPAEADGRLHPGDKIIAVASEGEENVDVIDLPLRKVVRMIRGPKGTKVFLTVLESGKGIGGVPVVIDLVRDEVKLTNQAAQGDVIEVDLPSLRDFELDLKIPTPDLIHSAADQRRKSRLLVLTVPSFYADFEGLREGREDYRSVSRDVRELIEDAKAEGAIDGVVLDLRFNGGGSLDEAIRMAGLFLPSEPIVQVRTTLGETQVQRSPDQEALYDGPLMVLVNKMSASASEIVTAALQDYDRAVVLGDSSTHGKGTVQHVYDMNRFFDRHPFFNEENAGSLKFTVAKYYRVNGGSTQLLGVVPDIELPSFTNHLDIGEKSLNGALRWDHIPPAVVPEGLAETVQQSPFDRLVGLLRQRSDLRREQDEAFADLRTEIARFATLQERKTLPLNEQRRLQMHAEEEEWLEEVRDAAYRRRNDDEEATVSERLESDLALQEAFRVMADMVWLQGYLERADDYRELIVLHEPLATKAGKE